MFITCKKFCKAKFHLNNLYYCYCLPCFIYIHIRLIAYKHSVENDISFYFLIQGYFHLVLVKECAQEKFLPGTDCFYSLPVLCKTSALKWRMKKTNHKQILVNVYRDLSPTILLIKSALNTESSGILLVAKIKVLIKLLVYLVCTVWKRNFLLPHID